MKHAYYLSDDLDELEKVHDELLDCGLKDRQIHVLSEQEAEVQKHHMRNVNSIGKTGMLAFMVRGALVGCVLAAAVIGLSYLMGVSSSVWMAPFIFAAVAAVGFSVWEAGLMGLHRWNSRYEGFQDELHQGEHMLILDYDRQQQSYVESVLGKHPKVCSVQP
ncbi:MAG: NAD/FAD-utilizing enzyme [Oleiphilus sp.]|nr:MAG: NAD/FAD-utilizing enzyme [Oleiphilus sp.]